MYPQRVEEVVLQRQQVLQAAVEVPRKDAYDGTSDRVEDEVVRRGDDGGEDDGRVDHARARDRDALPAHPSAPPEGHRGDGEAYEEGVAEVEGRHSS